MRGSRSRLTRTIAAGLLGATLACGGGRPPVAPVVVPVVVPAPAAAPSPLATARAACRAARAPDACDALADYWGSRELVPDGAAADGRVDAALLGDACAQRDDAAACLGVALMHKYGTAGARDDAAAKAGFARVRALGDLNGFRGDAASDEGRAALARTEASCTAGRARACTQLGWAAFSAVAQAKDVTVAYTSWRRGCDLGSSSGCRWAGHLAYVHPEVNATADAERLLRGSCAAENPSGCDELGRYLTQRGDAAAATPFFAAACAGGSRAGCADAGAARAQAGTAAALAEAAALYRRACDAGDPAGCARLGAALDHGVGVAADRAGAATAYVTACKGDEASGCAGLAASFQQAGCRLGIEGAPPRLDDDARTVLQAACAASSDAAICAAVSGCPRP